VRFKELSDYSLTKGAMKLMRKIQPAK
jgi:hypothetical protein